MKRFGKIWAFGILCGLPQLLYAASSDWAEAPKPAYPLNAAIQGNTGEVKLHVVVNGDGRVREAGIVKSSGNKELDYAARSAVLNWRLEKSKIQSRDLTTGRDVIVSFQETAKERRIAAAVLRRASEKGSAWKDGGFFAFPPDAVYPEARRTARIRFTIAPDGHPRTVQLVQSSGSKSLDAAALRGIETWRAYPEWVGETAEVPVTFEAPFLKRPRAESHERSWQRYVVFAPKPDYPYEARAKYITGSGVYLLTFNKDGHVENVQVAQSTGSSILDSAAMTAFQKWRATPNPPFLQAKVPVTFSMSGRIDAGSWRLGQPELVGRRRE
ncbi:MAG TPA: energy transducer TonB [Chthoniobacterales bacterium]|nr:energy transducer TonB [Chthoniobacterales bacterium]